MRLIWKLLLIAVFLITALVFWTQPEGKAEERTAQTSSLRPNDSTALTATDNSLPKQAEEREPSSGNDEPNDATSEIENQQPSLETPSEDNSQEDAAEQSFEDHSREEATEKSSEEGVESPDTSDDQTAPSWPSSCKITVENVDYATRSPRDYSVNRPTLEDRVSVYKYKQMSEVCYADGSAPQPKGFNRIKLTRELMPCLQNGTVIHIDGQSARRFVEEIRPIMPVSYILVCVDFDNGPGFDSFWRILEEDPQCLGWFVADSDLPLDVHPSKHHVLPLGLTQWEHDIPQAHTLAQVTEEYNFNYTAAGQPLQKIKYEHTSGLKSPSIGVDFNLRNGPTLDGISRSHAWSRFCWNLERGAPDLVGHVKCTGSEGVFAGHLDEHYKKISEVDFAISPRGGGIDCYRHWEMLYLGVYPIVERTTLVPAFDNMPAMIVDNWNEVSLEKLIKFKAEADSTHYEGYRTLYVEYWEEEIWKLRPKSTRNVRLLYEGY